MSYRLSKHHEGDRKAIEDLRAFARELLSEFGPDVTRAARKGMERMRKQEKMFSWILPLDTIENRLRYELGEEKCRARDEERTRDLDRQQEMECVPSTFDDSGLERTVRELKCNRKIYLDAHKGMFEQIERNDARLAPLEKELKARKIRQKMRTVAG